MLRFRIPALLIIVALLAAIAYGVWRVSDSWIAPAVAVAIAAWFVSDAFLMRQPRGQEHMTHNPNRRD